MFEPENSGQRAGFVLSPRGSRTTKRGRTDPENGSNGQSKRAVAYLRVSTEEQHIGPQAQRDAIEAWAAREGIEVVDWFSDEGFSGKSPPGKRPALTEALTALHEHEGGILVVARRDRLARDVMIAGYLEMKVRQAGARIVSVAGEGTGDDSPTDRLMRQIIDAFAEYERQIIAARTRAALQAKKARGERAGNLPWGYRADENGRLVQDVDEQLVIARIRDLRDEGTSIRGVVRCLAEEGYRSRVGRPLTQGTIWNILCALDGRAA